MLLLSDDVKQVLMLLDGAPQHQKRMCGLSMDYLLVSEHTQPPMEPKEHQVVSKLSSFFRLAAHHALVDLDDALLVLGLSDAFVSALKSVYEANRVQLRDALGALESSPAEFEHLEWRLSQVVGSRSLHRMHDTQYLLSLKTSDVEKPHLLSADVPTLAHISSELRHAFQERNSAYMKRVKRNIVK